jgi:small-conductance mechanosensitive channel
MTLGTDPLQLRFLSNTLQDWALAALAILATVLILPFIKQLVRARQAHWRRLSTDSPPLELLSQLAMRTSRLVRLIIALYLVDKILTLPKRVDDAFDIVIVCGVWFQSGIWASTALRFFVQYRQRRSGLNDDISRSSLDVVMFVANLLIWSMFALLALDNLGINVTTLVAGLGVGGIAIALAVQTILGDLLGSLSIALDKPFVVGDLLRIDEIEGTVEHIGIKSTRLRSISGEQVIVANADMLKSRVRNLGRMPERRTLFRLYVAYDTPAERIGRVPGLVEDAVRAQPETRFVSCLLASLGRDALEFEVIYFVANRDAEDVPRTNDAVNRGIVERFATHGIGFAYPTQRTVP